MCKKQVDSEGAYLQKTGRFRRGPFAKNRSIEKGPMCKNAQQSQLVMHQNVTFFGEYIILTKLHFVIRRPSNLSQNTIIVVNISAVLARDIFHTST
jgi:hypothetical protein